MNKCKRCDQWPIKGSDEYCSYCGFLQMPIAIEPLELKMISEIVVEKEITFTNTGERDMDIEISPSSRPFHGLAFLPFSSFSVAAKKSTIITVKLDESLLPLDFSMQTVTYDCVINKDKRKSIRLAVNLKAGPKPVALTSEIRFGDVQEGKKAESWVEISNQGGIPLRFKEVLVEGSSQFQVPQTMNLLTPGERVRLPVVWESPAVDPTINRALLGVRIRFANSKKELFIPIKGQLFRFQLEASPHEIKIPEALSKQTYTEEVQLFNHGTKDIEITAIESDQEWIQVVSRAKTLTLLCQDSPRKAPAGSTVYKENYSFEIVLQPKQLNEGLNRGKVIIHTTQEDIGAELNVQLFIIHPKKCDDCIGIDFGTSNSVVAIWDNAKGDILLVEDENPATKKKTSLIPSVLVFQGSEENYKIGIEAEAKANIFPEMSVRSIKRIMGYGYERTFFEKSFSPEKLAALIIKKLVEYAEEKLYTMNKAHQGKYLDITKAIVTVPANFYDLQIGGILDACKMAGIDVEEDKQKEIVKKIKETIGHDVNAGIILDEPSAAALFYLGLFQKDGRFDAAFNEKFLKNESIHFLIFDYGGGTLDVSVVQIAEFAKKNIGIKVLANKGDNNIGGDSIDITIMRALLNICQQQYKDFDLSLISENFNELEKRRQQENWDGTVWSEILRARGKWKKAAENLKIALDNKNEVEFKFNESSSESISDIFYIKDRKINFIKGVFQTKVTRDQVAQWINKILDRCQAVVREALVLVKLNSESIDYIIHTGRSSLMPLIRDKVKDIFPKVHKSCDILDKEHVKVCVAKGAVLYGLIRSGIQTEQHVRLVSGGKRLPHSYGIQVMQFLTPKFEPIIEIGREYPTEEIKHYNDTGNRYLNLKLLQNSGKDNNIRGNPEIRMIGSITVDTLADNIPGCDVKITIDANRKMEVTADGQPIKIEPIRLKEEEESWMS